ncbi:Lactoylglutathione lyase and related lyase [Gloeomargarita lithophora Alchichica-D10]|uniref:Lactoylglutathione lyase and related lyase n=1 Tax=Gloeomargarita lithophora Alchichica-D10 TaxID=1188229 RepID=A0A1J0AEM6_9CYAN|nr:VOC family protein [Gloeomargarita lithophora]APB34347.1 Lactoylglutathione lyase and related lyase [Gloeomargarita lithophora Alchichica-D10]
MQLVHYLHTAITVNDLERSQHFYGEILGLELVHRPLNFPGCWYEIQGIQIHLIQHFHPPTLLPDPAKWGRNAHLAFAVADLPQAAQELLSAGYPVQKSSSGRAALFTQDPDGHIIELSQWEP